MTSVFDGAEKKKRNFTETIELQIVLKNMDLTKDKRISGQVRLPYVPRQKFAVCIFGDASHCDEAKGINLDAMSMNDLTKFNKNKKLIKKNVFKKYDAFLVSADLSKKIFKVLPGINRTGKFPMACSHEESLVDKVAQVSSTVTFNIKHMALACAVGNVSMKQEEVITNVTLSINFLISLLKKKWQNVKRLYIKSTMGKPHRIFGY